MQHLVKKQVIDITCSKRADAFRMQQQLSSHYWQDVLPLLEKIFNEFSDEGKVIHIDLLEIDLGCISEAEMNQPRWDDAILSRIRKQLYEKLGGKEKNKLGVQEVARMSICRQWLFYMQKGYLPWNVLRIDDAWYYKVLEVLASDFTAIAALRKLMRQNPGVIRRIIEQHDESYLIKLVEVLTAVSQRDLAEMVKALTLLASSHAIFPTLVPGHNEKELKRKIWYWVLELAATEQDSPHPLLLMEKVLLRNTTHYDIGRITSDANPSFFTIILPAVTKLYQRPELFSENQLVLQKNNQINKDKNESKSADSGVDEEGIFVQHAGLVLIHPFLYSLFKHLKLIADSKFAGKAKQQKAIYILHYLAAGSAIAEEHELVLPKVLCEWPVEMPIEKNIEISDEELYESDNMLQAAIDQWPVLKNTSIFGLREAFLQRKGKIFSKNDKLYLQVESGSIDVLLDQLPWNLSMIKLPWMKGILRVNWR